MKVIPDNFSGSDEITKSTFSFCNAGRASNAKPGLMSISTSGHFCLNFSKTGNNHSKHAWHSIAMWSRPDLPALRSSNSDCKASISGRILLASLSSLWPATDKRIGLDFLIKSSTPVCYSNPLIWWLKADWVIFNKSAARATPPASCIARIVLRWRNSICIFIWN